jgi:pSer/pThr/pTyr-binding forkhead associated (FHA) protein
MSVLRLIPLKGEAIVVDADEALVGREANCNVVVSHPSVSRRHAVIKRKQDVFFVVDQGSANGTFVDSKRIVDAALKDGCVLRFGSASFKVEVRDELPVESIGEEELVVAATMVGGVGLGGSDGPTTAPISGTPTSSRRRPCGVPSRPRALPRRRRPPLRSCMRRRLQRP